MTRNTELKTQLESVWNHSGPSKVPLFHKPVTGQVLFLPFGVKTDSRVTATKAALQLAEHSILYYVICQKHQRKNGGKVDEI